ILRLYIMAGGGRRGPFSLSFPNFPNSSCCFWVFRFGLLPPSKRGGADRGEVCGDRIDPFPISLVRRFFATTPPTTTPNNQHPPPTHTPNPPPHAGSRRARPPRRPTRPRPQRRLPPPRATRNPPCSASMATGAPIPPRPAATRSASRSPSRRRRKPSRKGAS